jgi:hypothetical protein
MEDENKNEGNSLVSVRENERLVKMYVEKEG